MENLQANLTLIQQRLAAASDGKYPVPKLIAVTKRTRRGHSAAAKSRRYGHRGK